MYVTHATRTGRLCATQAHVGASLVRDVDASADISGKDKGGPSKGGFLNNLLFS